VPSETAQPAVKTYDTDPASDSHPTGTRGLSSMPTDMLIIGNQLETDWEERTAEINRRCKRHADAENHDTTRRDAADLEDDSQGYDKSDDTDMYELPKDGKSLSRRVETEVSMYQHFRWNTRVNPPWLYHHAAPTLVK